VRCVGDALDVMSVEFSMCRACSYNYRVVVSRIARKRSTRLKGVRIRDPCPRISDQGLLFESKCADQQFSGVCWLLIGETGCSF
jgi:hypothetical protein